jgi:hypothetical protein
VRIPALKRVADDVTGETVPDQIPAAAGLRVIRIEKQAAEETDVIFLIRRLIPAGNFQAAESVQSPEIKEISELVRILN